MDKLGRWKGESKHQQAITGSKKGGVSLWDCCRMMTTDNDNIKIKSIIIYIIVIRESQVYHN